MGTIPIFDAEFNGDTDTFMSAFYSDRLPTFSVGVITRLHCTVEFGSVGSGNSKMAASYAITGLFGSFSFYIIALAVLYHPQHLVEYTGVPTLNVGVTGEIQDMGNSSGGLNNTITTIPLCCLVPTRLHQTGTTTFEHAHHVRVISHATSLYSTTVRVLYSTTVPLRVPLYSTTDTVLVSQ